MTRTVLLALVSLLPTAFCVPVLQAQDAARAMDASRMPESGPAVVGGTGQTVGPNSKNQAVMPLPGLRQHEELSEPPRDATLPVPEVRPVPGPQSASPSPSGATDRHTPR